MASNPSSSSSSSSSDKLNNGNSSKYCSATLDDAFFKTSLKNNGKMSNFQVLASCANLLTVTDDLHSCAVSDGEDSTKVKRTRKKKRKIYRRSLSVSDISYYINSNSTKKHNIPSEKESNEIDLHSDKSNNKSLINYNSYSKQQKITLIFLAVINFGAYLSMSVIAPFFPIEAEERGMPLSVIGYVFSSYALVMFLVSPVLGKTITKLGVKFTFISGVFLSAGCNILFGALDYIDDVTIFTVFCFILRSTEALGAAAFVTASFTFVAEIFPNNLSAAIGIIETFVGLGMCVGPAVGSALYFLGGYELPFYVLGSILMTTVPVSIFILPNLEPKDQQHSTKSTNLLRLAIIPKILIINLVIMVLCGIWGFLEPTLEPHLREFGVTPATVGFLFLLISGTYSVTCPIIGRVSDKWGLETVLMSTGLVLTAVCLLLMGPDILLPFLPRTLWLNITGLTIMGITIGIGLIPTFHSMLHTAYDNGYEENTVTYGLISSLFSSFSSLGEFVGPALGSFLYQNYSYDFASTSIALFAFAIAILLLVYEFSSISRCRKKNEVLLISAESSSTKMFDSGIYESIITDEEDNETSPLLYKQNSVP